MANLKNSQFGPPSLYSVSHFCHLPLIQSLAVKDMKWVIILTSWLISLPFSFIVYSSGSDFFLAHSILHLLYMKSKCTQMHPHCPCICDLALCTGFCDCITEMEPQLSVVLPAQLAVNNMPMPWRPGKWWKTSGIVSPTKWHIQSGDLNEQGHMTIGMSELLYIRLAKKTIFTFHFLVDLSSLSRHLLT